MREVLVTGRSSSAHNDSRHVTTANKKRGHSCRELFVSNTFSKGFNASATTSTHRHLRAFACVTRRRGEAKAQGLLHGFGDRTINW